MTGWRLVSDVGGTNARFARSDAACQLSEQQSVPLGSYDSFDAALAHYVVQTGGSTDCLGAAIGAAGPVDGDRVQLTNADWLIDAAQISSILDGVPARLVNDLEAAAMALPFLSAGDTLPFGDPQGEEPGRALQLAINVGTGFGAASVVPRRAGKFLTRPSEAGHMTLAPLDSMEGVAFGECHSIEDVLSGHGLADLHARLCAGTAESPTRDAADVLERCKRDAAAIEAVKVFTRLLGRVCGDLVLANAAWGGVFLFGSVINGWHPVADPAVFRQAFDGQSAMRDRLHDVPSSIVTRPDAPLLGLAHLPLGD